MGRNGRPIGPLQRGRQSASCGPPNEASRWQGLRNGESRYRRRCLGGAMGSDPAMDPRTSTARGPELEGGDGMTLEITEVRISLRDDDKLKAFASMTFNDAFVIRGLKIIEGTNGMFVAMPSRKRPDGTYQDVAHPINNETRKFIEDRILMEYEKERLKQPSLLVTGT